MQDISPTRWHVPARLGQLDTVLCLHTSTRTHPCLAELTCVFAPCHGAYTLGNLINGRSANPCAIRSCSFLLGSSFLVPFLLCLYNMVAFSDYSHRDPLPGVFGRLGACHSPSPTKKPQRHYITLPMPSFCASKTRLPTIGPARITHKAGNWPRPDSHTPLQSFIYKRDSIFLLLSKT